MNVVTNMIVIGFVIATSAAAMALTDKSCDASENWTLLETTNKKSPKALFDLDSNKITLGKPFSFRVAVCGDEEKMPDRVTANAVMPAHQHGMNYTPTVTFDETSNNYEVEDFLFHMPGVWEITISSYRGEDVTHHTKSITLN